MSDAPESSAEAGELRALLARLRDVVEAKDTKIAVLREQCRLLELKVAELERRLGQDSATSGMAPSKDPIGARERRKAERAREKKERQVSERERSEDRKRGGQPGHPGAGLSRDPDPAQRKAVKGSVFTVADKWNAAPRCRAGHTRIECAITGMVRIYSDSRHVILYASNSWRCVTCRVRSSSWLDNHRHARLGTCPNSPEVPSWQRDRCPGQLGCAPAR